MYAHRGETCYSTDGRGDRGQNDSGAAERGGKRERRTLRKDSIHLSVTSLSGWWQDGGFLESQGEVCAQ